MDQIFKSREIGGKIYRVQKLPASKGVKLQMRLAKMLGYAADSMATLPSDAVKNANANSKEIFSAIGQFLVNINPDESADFVIDLCQMAIGSDGQSILFDFEFNSNLVNAYKLAWFVLEVNLGDFLDASPAAQGLGNKLKSILEK